MKINRRTLLRGLAGSSLGLPLLEAMFDGKKAYAQVGTPPRRYVIVYCGQSIEGEDASEDGASDLFVPDAPGALNAPLKLALAPLESLKSQLSIISNLEIPVQENGIVTPGSRFAGGFHYTTLAPLVTGMHIRREYDDAALADSSDVIVARQLGQNTQVPMLAYRAQAAEYQDYNVDALSWNAPTFNGQWINARPIDPVASPRLAYNSLFSTFTPPGGPDPAVLRALQRRRSVVDLVRRDTEKLLPKLGVADRQKMSQHLDAVRTLENRLAAIEASTGSMSNTCVQPAAPGTDPMASPGGNYSDEETRAYAFEDLIHMALACDLTRVVSYQITASMPGMTLPRGLPVDDAGTPLRYTDWQGESVEIAPTDLHNVSHNCSNRTHALTVSWHVKHFANLLRKLRDTPEANGSLLDHTVVIFLMEGGAGNAAPHTSERMAAIVAGGSSCGLQLGQHFVTDRQHPASVLLTAMNAAGVSQSALGEISERIDGLLI